MAFANVNIGSYAADGTGDPIRVAFAKINQNFANIATGQTPVTVNAPVLSVAGRTGNIQLTVNDIAGAVSASTIQSIVDSGYSDANVSAYLPTDPIIQDLLSSINYYGDANVAAYLPTDAVIIGINANISAANVAIAGKTTTDYVDTAITTAINNLINSAPGTLDTLGEIAANLATDANSIGTIIGGITGVNANVAAANLAIATLQTQVYSNANVASYLLGGVTVGNLSLDGNVNYQVPGLGGSGLFGINSWYPVNLTVNDGADLPFQTWNFGTTGDLTLPGNILAGDGSAIQFSKKFEFDNSNYHIQGDTISFVANTAYPAVSWNIVTNPIVDDHMGNVIYAQNALTAPYSDSANVGVLAFGGPSGSSQIWWEGGAYSSNQPPYVNSLNLNSTANVVVSADNETYNWIFSNIGSLVMPGALTLPGAITWTYNNSQIYEDSQLVLNAPLGVALTSPNSSQIVSNSNTWTFGTNGDLTVPHNILAESGNDLTLKVFNPDVSGGVTYTVQNWQADTNQRTTQFEVTPTDIKLTTDFSGAKNQWRFDAAGNLTVNSGGRLVFPYNNNSNAIIDYSQDAGQFFVIQNNYVDGYQGINLDTDDGYVEINSKNTGGNPVQSWRFNTNGQIQFPDGSYQATAWPGSLSYSSITGTPVPGLFTQGDPNPSVGRAQITFGYNGTSDYPHWIHTTHNAGSPVYNAISFYTNDGTQNATFPTNGVLGLTVTNGNIVVANSLIFPDNTVQTTAYTGSTYGDANVAAYIAGNLSTVNANIAAANAAIVTANTAMKGYVDAQIVSAANTGNITFNNYTISTVGDTGGNFGITLNPANGGEVHIDSYTGINNNNPGYWLHVGDGSIGAANNTGNVSIDFNNGIDSARGSVILDWAWWDSGSRGNNNRGTGPHTHFGIYKNDDTHNTRFLEFEYPSGNATVGNLFPSRIYSNNYLFANGVNILSTVGGSTYANANVAAYLIANPQSGTYSNANVASYLVASAQTIGNLTVSGTTTIGSTLQLVGGTNTITTTNGSSVQFGSGVNFNSSTRIAVNGNIVAQSGAASTSTNTGAIQVSGGVGVSGSIYTGGNVTAPYFVGNAVGTTATYTGNVQAAYFVGNGAALTGITANGYGNIYGTTSNVTLVAGTYNYVFDTTGNLTIPANGDLVMNTGGTIGTVVGTNANITINPDGAGQLVVTNITPAWFGNTVNIVGNLTVNGINSGYAPNRPAFRVYGSGTTNNLSTTVNTNGILNSNNWAVDYQQGNYLNGTTGVFTAPVSGLYSIHLNARVTNNTAPSAQVVVVKNYATTNVVQCMWETAANPTINHFGVSTIARLSAGDTLAVRVLMGSINFDGNDSWAVAYIG